VTATSSLSVVLDKDNAVGGSFHAPANLAQSALGTHAPAAVGNSMIILKVAGTKYVPRSRVVLFAHEMIVGNRNGSPKGALTHWCPTRGYKLKAF
jgi:hypothetical protein